MATVATALELARSFLGDDDRVEWSDARLMPKVRQAHGEIIAKAQLNGLQVIQEESTPFLVPANTTDFSSLQPVDLVEPIKIEEYGVGETPDQGQFMARKAFIPTWIPTETLRVWAWRENKILFLGATTARNIILYYRKGILAPTQVNDPLPVLGSEIYIGPRVAALAVLGTDRAEKFGPLNQEADDNLSLIIRRMVKSESNLPARRRPFSARYRRGRRYSF